MKRNDIELLYVCSLLGYGEENAIKGEDLMRRASFKSIRQLRERVEYERSQGAVICTSNRGYFLPERDEYGELTPKGAAEVRRFYRQQRAKGVGTLHSAKSAKKALREYDQRNQTRLPGVKNVEAGNYDLL